MKEVTGDIWSYWGREGFIVVIPCNADRKTNGKNIMGKGIAAQARLKISGIEQTIGDFLSTFGPRTIVTENGWAAVFTKYHWWEKSDLELIVKNVDQLKDIAQSKEFKSSIFVMPRLGCGSGGLQWSEVGATLRASDLPDNIWIIHRGVEPK